MFANNLRLLVLYNGMGGHGGKILDSIVSPSKWQPECRSQALVKYSVRVSKLLLTNCVQANDNSLELPHIIFYILARRFFFFVCLFVCCIKTRKSLLRLPASFIGSPGHVSVFPPQKWTRHIGRPIVLNSRDKKYSVLCMTRKINTFARK